MSIIRHFEISENPLSTSFDLPAFRQSIATCFKISIGGRVNSIRFDMAKGSSRFGSHLHIENYLSKASLRLAAERDLWRKSPAAEVDWAERFAHYLGEINAAHPFREGNGRTQRLFIGQLAREFGFEIRWYQMTPPEMVAASIASFEGYNEQLKLLIQKHLVAS
jgi:cell filamentation protein